MQEVGTTTLGRDGQAWILALHGEHDLATAPRLEQRMRQLHASGTSVVIDLTDSTFIDCQVIDWLVNWSRRARRSATLHLAIVAADDSFAKRVIDLVGIQGQIPCHATTADALDAVRAEPGG